MVFILILSSTRLYFIALIWSYYFLLIRAVDIERFTGAWGCNGYSSACVTYKYPICNIPYNSCSKCATDSDCASLQADAKCVSGECKVSCTPSNRTACDKMGAICSALKDGTASGYCVMCNNDTDCKTYISKALMCYSVQKYKITFCGECTRDSDCLSNSCDFPKGCRKCSSDAQCTTPPLSHCYNTSVFASSCVECVQDSHCISPPYTKCSILKNCGICTRDSDCTSAPNLKCTTSGNCVECISNFNCMSNPLKPICSNNNTCVACNTIGANCSTGLVCRSDGACVECLNNTNCILDSFKPICSINNTCIACTTIGVTCSPGLVCRNDGACVQCFNNNHCLNHIIGKGLCSNGTCTRCTSDNNCTSLTHSYCNSTSGGCSPCLQNSHCSHFDTVILSYSCYLDNRTCINCPANCTVCLSVTYCAVCRVGFELTRAYDNSTSFCKPGCSDSSAFFYPDGQCRNSCPPPFQPRYNGSRKFCDSPTCLSTPCKKCTTKEDCPTSDYYCDLNAGGACVLNMAKLQVETPKAIVNGYTIIVGVVPTSIIMPEIDEYLNISIDMLQDNVDFKIEITNIDKGIFKVQLKILRSLQISDINIRFTYSPQRLNLLADTSVPKIVYLSEGTLEAAQKIDGSSNGLLIILIISSVSFAILGKLSKVWSFLALNQYLYHLLYLNLQYLEHTKTYFRSLGNYNMIFVKGSQEKQTTYLLSNVNSGIPQRFLEEEYSTNFFSNAGQIICIIAGMLLALGVSRFIIDCFKFEHRIFWAIRNQLQWNGILRQMMNYAQPATVACFVQVFSSIFGKESHLVSLIVAVMFLLIFCITFIMMFPVITNIPEDLFARVSHLTLYRNLWEGLSITSHAKFYYYALLIRGVVLAYLSVYMDLFPFAQIIVLIIFQCGILAFFFKKEGLQQVLKEETLNIFCIIIECFLLIMKLLLLTNIILNSIVVDDEILVRLGWCIIIPGVLMQGLQAVYAIYSQIKNWRKIWHPIRDFIRRVIFKKPKKPKILRVRVLPIRSSNKNQTIKADQTNFHRKNKVTYINH